MMPNRRAVLLDRDGTIIVERNYLSDPDHVELLPGAAEALRQLRRLGWQLVLITNQSGIGRGLFSFDRLEQIHARLRSLLAAEGVELDGIYCCPHAPTDECACRKPRTALANQAAAELGFDPTRSVVIGDKRCDVELGRQIGARTVLVRTGYGAQEAAEVRNAVDRAGGEGVARPAEGVPDHVVDALDDAVAVIHAEVDGDRGHVPVNRYVSPKETR